MTRDRLGAHLRLVEHVDAAALPEQVAEGHAHERLGVVDLHLAERQRGARSGLLAALGHLDRGLMHQRLGHLQHGPAVAEGLVGLHGGELGVVAAIHALVAEVAVDLEHLRHAAHEQALQVQLGCHAQEQVHVERVVRGDEWTRRSAARERLHHGRFHFHESTRLHEAAHQAHDAAARLEGGDGLGRGPHVHVAAAIARLAVLEAVPLARRRRQALALHGDVRGPHAGFALVGATHRAFGADDVAVVERLGQLEVGGAHASLADAHLQIAGVIAQPHEHQLAKVAVLHDAARHAAHGARLDGLVRWIGLRLGGLGVGGHLQFLAELGARGGERHQPLQAATEGLQLQLVAEAFQLGTARSLQRRRVLFGCGGFILLLLVCGHRTNSSAGTARAAKDPAGIDSPSHHALRMRVVTPEGCVTPGESKIATSGH